MLRLIHCRCFSLLTLSCVAAVTALGCGDKVTEVAPVNGKVLLDGQPLTIGQVLTTPSAGRGAKGDIQPDGSFELSTFGNGDGAIPGSHMVSVNARAPSSGSGPEAPLGKLLIPKRYASSLESGLTIEVKAGEDNSPVLNLKSK